MWGALTGFFTAVGRIVVIGSITKILAAIGLTWYTYDKVQDILNWAFAQMTSYFDFLPTELLQILKISRIDEAISIVCSAMLSSVIIRFGAGMLGVRT